MIELSFLRTRIARRVFALFLLSALIPTVILAGIAYRQVNRQLTAQSVERLRQLSKLHGQALQERLAAASVDVADAARTIHQRGGQGADLDSLRSVQTRFVAFDLTLGETVVNSGPSRRDGIEHLGSGRALLDISGHEGGSRVRLGVALDPEDPANGVLWGEIDPDYLWGSEDDRIGAAGTPVCVVRGSEPLYCERAIPRESLGALSATVTSRESARFEWRDEQEGRDFIAARWDAFLDREYMESSWSVVASMARDEVLAPVSRFKATFLLTLLVSVGVVFVFSSIQIRRSLEPVRQLTEGTRRVANRDFEAQVEVSTRDEFGELAESFNLMAGTLERQFSTLEAMSDLDRAVLSSLDVSGIAETVLAKGARIARADSVAVGFIGSGKDIARVSTQAPGGSAVAKSSEIPWTPSLTRELAGRGASAWLEPGSEFLESLPSIDEELGGQLLLPLIVDGDVAGWMSLGYAPGHRCSEDDRSHARRLADQVSIGLANARLVERLDELGWGTIRALARTIDAKSRWTAGHSERVTAHAVRLGEALGLVSEDLTLIERGGLLHDIGKIGVPAKILDKPTRLTDEEYDVVKQHPVIGARILEPVAGLEPVIGMVRSHHERMDGAGYPDGLAGEDIPFLARLMAVADVWDSLRSERPYRPALPVELTTEIMIEGRGGHFDPAMLDVFLELDLDNERNPDEPESEAAIPDTQPLEETHAS